MEIFTIVTRNFLAISVNAMFTTCVKPLFTALSKACARRQTPLACVVRAPPINRTATLIPY
jgi:hypothetical protein